MTRVQNNLNNPQSSYYVTGLISLVAVITALAHIFTAISFEINWDEFFYLDWVYQWKAGKLNAVLQTIFLRAFTWLPSVSDNEVEQIVAGRLVMLGLLTASCAMLWSISRRFYTARATALALVTFLSFSFVFRHATSFRADMIVTTLCVSVFWLITKKQLSMRHIISGGVLFGLAGMVSIKAIFYAPTIGAIVFIRSIMMFSEDGMPLLRVFLKPIVIGVVSMISFASLFYVHSLTVSTAHSSIDYLNSVAGASLTEEGFFPRWDFFKLSVKRNIFHWVILIIGFVTLLKQIANGDRRWTAILSLSFGLPLLTLLFYTHAYSYYYVFMLAPVTLIMASAYDIKFFKKEAIRNIIPLVFLSFSLLMLIARGAQQTSIAQKQVITVTHSLFPVATPYIDRCAMISSSPKSGIFMSSWFMQNYYKKNEPIFDNVLRKEQPKFILANIESLDLDNITKDTLRRFLPEDEAVLKENYVHHWGPIYVAGKSFPLKANQSSEIDILIEGAYTVESRSPLKVQNKIYTNGDVIEVSRGNLMIVSAYDQEIILRWGDNLSIPKLKASNKPLFHGF